MNGKSNTGNQKVANQPTHDVKLKIRKEGSDKATYERIGAAWQREDGSFYVKLAGTQILTDGFNLYPVEGGAQ